MTTRTALRNDVRIFVVAGWLTMLTAGKCASVPRLFSTKPSIVAIAGVSVSPIGSPGIPLLRRLRRGCVFVVVVVALVLPLEAV